MIMQGIETLSLRVQREADNALALARYFKAHPLVEQVFYPGLEDDPHHELAARYLRHGFGCVLSVVLKGDKRQTESLVDHLRLVSHLANVGDNRTLIIQPAAICGNGSTCCSAWTAITIWSRPIRPCCGR